MQAFRTSVEINSRTPGSTEPSPSNSGTTERRTLAINEHARVSRIRNACVQNNMTGFNIPVVWSMNSLAVSWAGVPSVSGGDGGAANYRNEI